MLRNVLRLTEEVINRTGMILGTIIPYYRRSTGGFLICDGRSCSGYELEDIMENTPDLRGKFIRMIGGNSAEFGVTQEDAIRNIVGGVRQLYAEIDSKTVDPIEIGGPFAVDINAGTKYHGAEWTRDLYRGGFTFDASRVVPTAVENRPINVAMNYIIYAGKKKSSHS